MYKEKCAVSHTGDEADFANNQNIHGVWVIETTIFEKKGKFTVRVQSPCKPDLQKELGAEQLQKRKYV